MKWVVTAWEAVVRISLGHLPIMAANSLLIGVCNQEPFRLPEMQDKKFLMLCCRSVSRLGRERVACPFATRGCQDFDYVYWQPGHIFICRLTGPEIVDAPLMLIFKFGQGACCFSVAYQGCQYFNYVYSQPSCMYVSWLTRPTIVDTPLTLIFEMRCGECCILYAYNGYQYFDHVNSLPSWVFITRVTGTKIVDALLTFILKIGSGSVLRSLFPRTDANTSIMYICYQIAFLLPDSSHQKSLTLCCRWFCHWHIHNIPSFHLAEYIIYNILTAFLSSSGTIFFITSLCFDNTYK